MANIHPTAVIGENAKIDPTAQIRGCGGDFMRNAGADLLLHYKDMAFMGFWVRD